MAERLTEQKTRKGITKIVVKPFVDMYIVVHKLYLLEDIMEKYGIDIQNLDYILEDYSKNQGRYFAICEEMDDLKKDRDTWQKACELACEREDDCYVYDNIHRVYEFYQQAKKENNND